MIKFEIDSDASIDKEKFDEYLGSYSEYTGWMNLEKLKSELDKLENISNDIRDNSDALIVVGVGGPYMSSKAVNSAINKYFEKNFPVYYFGFDITSEYYNEVFEMLEDKDITVMVISKSGNTFETKLFYELVLKFMSSKYSPDEVKERIIVNTNNHDGYMLSEIKKHGFKHLIMPDDIGGRFSLFTSGHIISMLVNGIDVDSMFEGAMEAKNSFDDMVRYARVREEMLERGKSVEMYSIFNSKLDYLIEWLKQLYAESLGKNNNGVFPVKVIYNRDLHSLEQFIQEGNPILFETLIKVSGDKSINIVADAVLKAHRSRDMKCNVITLDEINEYNLGYLMQFFMYSVCISGFLRNVNPFTQYGVEKYKNEMKELLK